MAVRTAGVDCVHGRPGDRSSSELLDRQLIDSHGRLAGKADDLELTHPGGNLEQPSVTAILAGPAALAGRLHTPVGRWLARVTARLLKAVFGSPGQDGRYLPWDRG